MRLTYDGEADAAYLYLTSQILTAGRDITRCDCPDDVKAMVNLDWKDGKLVGLEVLDAKSLLFGDLLTDHANPAEYGEWPNSVVIGTMGVAGVQISKQPGNRGEFRVDIQNYGMKASTSINGIQGGAAKGFSNFVSSLAAEWKGWDGERIWRSETVQEQLTVSARASATGTIALTFALTEPDLGWATSTEVAIRAGEDMRRFADEVSSLLARQA